MNISIRNTKDWLISYNPYTDILQIYKKTMMTTDRKTLKSTTINSGIVFADNKDSTYLIELNDAYSKFGDIDNKTKTAIIKEVKEYVLSYGKN